MGFFLLKVGPPLEKFSGSAPVRSIDMFRSVNVRTSEIGLGLQNNFTVNRLHMGRKHVHI